MFLPTFLYGHFAHVLCFLRASWFSVFFVGVLPPREQQAKPSQADIPSGVLFAFLSPFVDDRFVPLLRLVRTFVLCVSALFVALGNIEHG